MKTDAYEQVEEALSLLNVTSEKIEDDDVFENIEAVIEMLEEAQHSMEVAEEMNEMMQEHGDNIEGFTEI